MVISLNNSVFTINMQNKKDLLNELLLLVKSRYGIIFLDTPEDERAEGLLKLLATRLELPFFTWSVTEGLKRKDIKTGGAVYGSTDISVAIDHIQASRLEAVYYFKGFYNYLDDYGNVHKLKDLALKFSKSPSAIFITGSGVVIPNTLKPHSGHVTIPLPDINEFRSLLNNIIRDLNFKQQPSIELSAEQTNQLLNNIKGLTLTEAEKILTKIIIEDNRLCEEDIPKVMKAKREIIEKHGILEYFPAERSMDEIADLKNLKEWLKKRKKIIQHPEMAREFGLSFPKGILLLGVPGCGKSLCAKAVANEWKLPLLKFDTSNLYNKYIGETEKNLKRVFEISEKMSPLVLWIDEIEKAFTFSESTHDGGVSMRIFGSFLSWMQDRKGDVFIVATANDVSKLPPELLRKGRFDEIFFVDLPDSETRESIFRIHLEKRGKDPDKFDSSRLALISEGFTGAEIEQVIVSGLYSAFDEGRELSTDILEKEIGMTSPLSVTMAARIDNLRNWAEGKTVSAN